MPRRGKSRVTPSQQALAASVRWWFGLTCGFYAGVGLARGHGAVDFETSMRTATAFSQNPNDQDLYKNDSEINQQFILRESIKYQAAKNTKFEFNIYNLLIGSGDKTSLAQTLLNTTDERNRSAALERHYHTSHQIDAYLTVDRLNVQTKVLGTEATVGRFPINLSTMSIFTTNDLFAPYRPFDYYREYKPGVDAVRFDHGIGKRGQVSVIGVAGYSTPAAVSRVNPSLGTPSDHFSPDAAAALARGAYTLRGVEASVFAGKLGTALVAGGALHGELGRVGLHAEGHQRSDQAKAQQQAEAALGFDLRLSAKLVILGEQFYNGGGYVRPEDYTSAATRDGPSELLLARLYTGLAANYELSPLTNLRALIIANDTDQSLLASANFVYSLAENAELVLSLLSPRGKGPDKLVTRSEFGTYPGIFTIQTGIYF